MNVEVIRCKDCKYCDEYFDSDNQRCFYCAGHWDICNLRYANIELDDYCSYAERKDENDKTM